MRVLEKEKEIQKSLDSDSIKSYSYYIKEKGFEKRKKRFKKVLTATQKRVIVIT